MVAVSETSLRDREAGASGIAVPRLTPSQKGRQDGTIKRMNSLTKSLRLSFFV
jgi:hypothetical protein